MSIDVSATVTGLRIVMKKLNKSGEDVLAAIGAAVYQKGFQIMASSIKEVPVDKGRLKGSAYVAPPKDLKDPVVEIGYGTKYAAAVHETWGEPRGDMSDAQRRAMFAAIKARGEGKKKGVGKKFFLRDPLNKHKRGYQRWITRKARENLHRGIGWRGVSGPLPARPKEGGG